MKEMNLNTSILTMKETVVFKASATEQGMEGVHCLFPRNRQGFQPVNIWSALTTQGNWINALCQFHIPTKANTIML